MIEVGAPTGKWQLIVVYRGKHCPVSRNYLASLQQIIYELDDLGVEVLALTADGREKAEAFVSPPLTVKFPVSKFAALLSLPHHGTPCRCAWLCVCSPATEAADFHTYLKASAALCTVSWLTWAGC